MPLLLKEGKESNIYLRYTGVRGVEEYVTFHKNTPEPMTDSRTPYFK